MNRYERRTARARASHAAKNSGSHVVAIQGAIIPARTLAAGNPTINKKNRDGKVAEWLALGADSYLALVQKYRESTRGSG